MICPMAFGLMLRYYDRLSSRAKKRGERNFKIDNLQLFHSSPGGSSQTPGESNHGTSSSRDTQHTNTGDSAARVGHIGL